MKKIKINQLLKSLFECVVPERGIGRRSIASQSGEARHPSPALPGASADRSERVGGGADRRGEQWASGERSDQYLSHAGASDNQQKLAADKQSRSSADARVSHS